MGDGCVHLVGESSGLVILGYVLLNCGVMLTKNALKGL